jgi:hypothetical protein
MPLDVIIGLVGVIVTILVVVGMILITPRGVDTSRPLAEPPGIDDVASSTPTPTATQPAPR